MQQYKKWRKILGSFGIFRALMDGWKTDLAATNFQRNIFLTYTRSDFWGQSLACVTWIPNNGFVHSFVSLASTWASSCLHTAALAEGAPLLGYTWVPELSRFLYSQVSHPQCPFCHHTGLETGIWNWLYNTSTKSSSGSSSEMFYCFLLQHPRTICVDKSRALFEMASMAMKLSRIDFREVSAHEYDGVTRASAITVLQACLSVVFLTWTYEREQRRCPIPGQIMTNS